MLILNPQQQQQVKIRTKEEKFEGLHPLFLILTLQIRRGLLVQKIKMMVMLQCKMVSTLLRNMYFTAGVSLTFSVGEQLVLTGR